MIESVGGGGGEGCCGDAVGFCGSHLSALAGGSMTIGDVEYRVAQIDHLPQPTPEQVKRFIDLAAMEAGPECCDEWFQTVAEALRQVFRLPPD
jgi:hypothetical protein